MHFLRLGTCCSNIDGVDRQVSMAWWLPFVQRRTDEVSHSHIEPAWFRCGIVAIVSMAMVNTAYAPVGGAGFITCQA